MRGFMKKLSISFVLLFGFLIFVPQIAMADVALPPGFISEQKRKEIENDLKKQYSACLQEHKSKLPKEYKGPNLTIIPESITTKYMTWSDE